MNPTEDKLQEVEAEVPMSEMHDFATALRSMTQGRGWFTLEFVRYEQLPQMLEGEVILKAKNCLMTTRHNVLSYKSGMCFKHPAFVIWKGFASALPAFYKSFARICYNKPVKIASQGERYEKFLAKSEYMQVHHGWCYCFGAFGGHACHCAARGPAAADFVLYRGSNGIGRRIVWHGCCSLPILPCAAAAAGHLVRLLPTLR